jgi:hypothetical protein
LASQWLEVSEGRKETARNRPNPLKSTMNLGNGHSLLT